MMDKNGFENRINDFAIMRQPIFNDATTANASATAASKADKVGGTEM